MTTTTLIYFLSALWLGFIVAIPPGSVTVIGLQYALSGSLKKTLLFIAGSSLIDLFYLILVYAGFATLIQSNTMLTIGMYFFSFILLLYTGITSLFSLKKNWATINTNEQIPDNRRSVFATFLQGAAVTLSNPPTVIGWLAIGGNFFLLWRKKLESATDLEPFAIICIIIGVEMWFVPMLFAAYKMHKKISANVYRTFILVSSCIIILFSLTALFAGISTLLIKIS